MNDPKNPTHNWTPHKAAMIQALVDGKTVQHYSIYTNKWQDTTCPSFEGSDGLYRIKPETTCRFWRADEVPLGWQARIKKKPDSRGLILATFAPRIGESIIKVRIGSIDADMDPQNYRQYEVAPPGPANAVEWQPAGVIEEG